MTLLYYKACPSKEVGFTCYVGTHLAKIPFLFINIYFLAAFIFLVIMKLVLVLAVLCSFPDIVKNQDSNLVQSKQPAYKLHVNIRTDETILHQCGLQYIPAAKKPREIQFKKFLFTC